MWTMPSLCSGSTVYTSRFVAFDVNLGSADRMQSFEVKDVKTLNPEALSRAIGRIAGKNGSMKYSVENATKTRIVLADSRIHSRVPMCETLFLMLISTVLGAFESINAARESIVRYDCSLCLYFTSLTCSSLILGQQPGKVFNNLRIISARMKERQF